MAPLLVGAFGMSLAAPAAAQTFTDTTAQPIGDSTACPGATAIGTNTPNFLTRTFNVTGISAPPSAVALSVGLRAQHTWRGDIRLRVTNPSGTAQTLIVEDTSGTGNIDDYNIELVDGADPTVNQASAGGDHTTPDDTNAPSYQNTVGPDAPLNALVSGTLNGNWVLEICDDYFGSDAGQYLESSLRFDVSTDADTALALALSNTNPASGGTVVATYTLTNSGPVTALDSTVNIANSGAVNVSNTQPSSGTSFAGTTWTVPSLPVGSTATLVVTTTVSSGTATYSGSITGATTTDTNAANDSVSQSVTAQPGTPPPVLSCDIGEIYYMRWSTTGANSWPAGTLSNSYDAVDTDAATPNIPLALSLATPGGGDPSTFLAGAITTPSPQTRANWDGGTGSAASLYIGLDFPDQAPSSKVIMTMDLGIPAEGVEKFQFAVTDIDQGSYLDRITVNGFANGSPVPTPTLTPGSNVTVTGNQGVSQNTGNVGATGSAGNLYVTFSDPVDQIVFTYDNAPAAPADPLQQAIALQDISICRRLLPDINATKTVEVYDPGNQGLFMTPGNEVLYTIAVENRGPTLGGAAEAAAADLDLSDILPDNLQFVSATASGFTAGSITNPIAPNTDCDGGACVVSFENGELGVDQVAQIAVRALIK